MPHPFRILGLAAASLLLAASPAAEPAGAAGPPQNYAYCPAVRAYEFRDCGPQHGLPASPAGRQLRWVLDLLADGGPNVSVAEVRAHVDPALLALFPAEQIAATFQATYAELGPGQFRGFDHPARDQQAVALVDTPHLRAAAAVGVDPASGLINELAVTEAPPMIVPHDAHSGWFDVGGRRLFLRCTGTGSPTVVFENGLTADWYALQNRLSGLTTRSAATTRRGRPARWAAATPRRRHAPASTGSATCTRCSPRRMSRPVRPRRTLQRRPVQPALRQPASRPGGRTGAHRRRAPRLPPPRASRCCKPFVCHREHWDEFAAHACDIPPAAGGRRADGHLPRRGADQGRAGRHPLHRMPLAVITHGGAPNLPAGWPGEAARSGCGGGCRTSWPRCSQAPPRHRHPQRTRHPARAARARARPAAPRRRRRPARTHLAPQPHRDRTASR